jgi:hypothetical protein
MLPCVRRSSIPFHIQSSPGFFSLLLEACMSQRRHMASAEDLKNLKRRKNNQTVILWTSCLCPNLCQGDLQSMQGRRGKCAGCSVWAPSTESDDLKGRPFAWHQQPSQYICRLFHFNASLDLCTNEKSNVFLEHLSHTSRWIYTSCLLYVILDNCGAVKCRNAVKCRICR